MSKTLFILSLLLFVAGAISISAHLASPVAANEGPVLSTDPDRLTLWNEDHCQITELIGDWRVRSAPHGSRMRPQHDDCYIRILSDNSGVESEFRVTTVGEVYIAHGWVAVNQVNQESWTAMPVDIPATAVCGDDPLECTASYLKQQVEKIIFEPNTCWQADEQPETGCGVSWTCGSGSTSCNVVFLLATGHAAGFESACGSGAKITQCKNADSGLVWICFCSNA